MRPRYCLGPTHVANESDHRTGSPHVELGTAWPMSLIVRILTSDDDDEIVDSLKQILSTTDGLGLIHESVDTNNPVFWSRQWYVTPLGVC